LEVLFLNLPISRQHWDMLLNELEQARCHLHMLTYRTLLERLQLPSPAMQKLVAALEHLAVLDDKADHPLRSALVVSQSAIRMPRPGFFECLECLGRFSGPPDSVAYASWHASEVVRVFEYKYPE
jgi:hypothetical protein